jgi:hypothetical protein
MPRRRLAVPGGEGRTTGNKYARGTATRWTGVSSLGATLLPTARCKSDTVRRPFLHRCVHSGMARCGKTRADRRTMPFLASGGSNFDRVPESVGQRQRRYICRRRRKTARGRAVLAGFKARPRLRPASGGDPMSAGATTVAVTNLEPR